MIIKKYIYIIFLLMVFIGSYSAAQTSACDKLPQADDKSIIALTGTLVSVTCWGAPNFGESPQIDRHFNAWILFLKNPLLICANNDIVHNRAMQISNLQVFPRDLQQEKIFGTLHKQMVHIEATVGAGDMPTEITSLTASVSTIKPVTDKPEPILTTTLKQMSGRLSSCVISGDVLKAI